MMDENNGPSTKGWDTYWQGAVAGDALQSGGFQHPAFAVLWQAAISEFLTTQATDESRFLDIGTGAGAVIEALSKVPGAKLENVSCVDVSAAAIDAVKNRFSGITGIVADANAMPLESASYDLITSQFGIEYAGPAAIDEAARLLATNGSLLFFMHIQQGSLYKESCAALDALQRTRQCDFIGLTRRFFEAGFAAARGTDRAPYEAAAAAMNPAIREIEAILTEHGEHVASDTIVTLYNTVQTIHGRIQHYNPDEVLAWLDNIERELGKHEERMDSMRDAALDEAAFKAICERLEEHGLKINRAQPSLVEGETLPIAWILQASRES
jgi:ubiquinone/menaquinone biosynthesis C-methylase UbiE